jgi:hypothetical protein
MYPHSSNPNPDQHTSSDAVDDGHIERLLRESVARHRDGYIDNNGFSDAVMARVAGLPASARATRGLSTQARFLIVACTTVFAALITMTIGAGGSYLIDAVMDLATQTITPAVIGLILVMVSMVIVAIGAANAER